MFLDPNALSLFDDQHSEEEERWITLGLDETGVLLVIPIRIMKKRNRVREYG